MSIYVTYLLGTLGLIAGLGVGGVAGFGAQGLAYSRK